MTRQYNKNRNLLHVSPIDTHKDLIVDLYSRMSRNEVYRELNSLGYCYPLNSVRDFIDNLGITRKSGLIVGERNKHECPLCHRSYIPGSARQTHCTTCIPKGDRRANMCVKVYGITKTHYDHLIDTQNNACAICRVNFTELKNRHIHLDHDHKTGTVRGILCHKCNHAIGLMKDNPTTLRAAAIYLEKTHETTQ